MITSQNKNAEVLDLFIYSLVYLNVSGFIAIKQSPSGVVINRCHDRINHRPVWFMRTEKERQHLRQICVALCNLILPAFLIHLQAILQPVQKEKKGFTPFYETWIDFRWFNNSKLVGGNAQSVTVAQNYTPHEHQQVT